MPRVDRLLAICALAAASSSACVPQASPQNVGQPAFGAVAPPILRTNELARGAQVTPAGSSDTISRAPSTPSLPASSSSSSSSSSSKAPAPVLMSVAKDPLTEQLLGGGGAVLKTVLASPEKYRFQVLYSVVAEGAKPSLERHGYRADKEYFYPASSMKVPITLALYDRLAVLRSGGRPGLTRDATIRIQPISGAGEPYTTTLARETWRALIVSDNLSANRLLAVVGHREVHETLWPLGLASARVHDGFATGGEIDAAEVSPRVDFATAGGPAASLPARRSNLALPATDAAGLAIGKASIVDGRRVEAPLSFADKNAMRLRDLQDTLVRIVRPDLLPAGSRASAASKEDIAYVKLAMGTLPSESGLAGFERNVVADYQLIPFLRGIERVRARGHFLIFTKVGQAFGFLIGNAYIVDKDTGRSFFLTAAVYANTDEVMNDDNYEYTTISFPALADVAEVFCRHAFGR